MTTQEPFVQLKVLQLLDAAPMLRGARGQVLWVIACFGADPLGPSIKDLCHYTGLARQHVANAVDFLSIHSFVWCLVDDDKIKRYRPSEDYFHYGAREPVSVREIPRASRLQSESVADHGTQKVTRAAVVVSRDPTHPRRQRQQQLFCQETFAVLSGLSTPVEEPALSVLSITVTPDNARAWFVEWVPNAPKSFSAPLAYAIKRLLIDPAARPGPQQQKRQNVWWLPEYDDLVNR